MILFTQSIWTLSTLWKFKKKVGGAKRKPPQNIRNLSPHCHKRMQILGQTFRQNR